MTINWVMFTISAVLFVASLLFTMGGIVFYLDRFGIILKDIIDYYFSRKEQHYNELIKSGLDIGKFN